MGRVWRVLRHIMEKSLDFQEQTISRNMGIEDDCGEHSERNDLQRKIISS
jgi:hypothetical protein